MEDNSRSLCLFAGALPLEWNQNAARFSRALQRTEVIKPSIGLRSDSRTTFPGLFDAASRLGATHRISTQHPFK